MGKISCLLLVSVSKYCLTLLINFWFRFYSWIDLNPMVLGYTCPIFGVMFSSWQRWGLLKVDFSYHGSSMFRWTKHHFYRVLNVNHSVRLDFCLIFRIKSSSQDRLSIIVAPRSVISRVAPVSSKWWIWLLSEFILCVLPKGCFRECWYDPKWI